MEKSTKKKVIIVAALLVIGGTVGYFLWKRNKDKKAADEAAALSLDPGSTPSGDSTYGSGSGTSTSTIDANVPPPTIPADVLASSFAALKTTLGANAKNYGTYLIFETNQKSLGIGGGTAKVIVKFTNGGRWAVFIREVKLANRLNEGAYYSGGKKIVVYSGKNKGLVVEGSSVMNNLARAAK